MAKEKRRFKVKGEPGYISFSKMFNLMITFVLALFCAGLLIPGFLAFESKLNICVIVGILFVIPAARFFTVWVLFMPFKSVTQEKADEMMKLMKGGNLLYSDVIITSTEKAYFLPFVVITGDKILAFYSGKEKLYKVQEYFADVVKRRGFDYKTTVTDDEAKFKSLLRAADSFSELQYESQEDKEQYEAERARLCENLEAMIP